MNPATELDRVFPLSAGSSERPRLRAPLVLSGLKVSPGIVMGNRAFMRTWAARRAKILASASVRPV